MSGDTSTKAPAPAWRHAGSGHSSNFLCAKCHKGRSLLGHKKERVRGIWQQVCVDCARPKP